MNVVEFNRENWRDPARTLRQIADDLDSGTLEACSVGAVSMLAESGKIEVFAFGPVAEDLQALAVMRLGEQKLVDIIMETAGDA